MEFFLRNISANNLKKIQCIFINVCKNSACYPRNHWIFQYLAESSHVAKNNSIQKPLQEEGKMVRFVFIEVISFSSICSAPVVFCHFHFDSLLFAFVPMISLFFFERNLKLVI